MAAVKNARDSLLQAASPRIEPAALPSNISVGWNANILDRPTDDELLNKRIINNANIAPALIGWSRTNVGFSSDEILALDRTSISFNTSASTKIAQIYLGDLSGSTTYTLSFRARNTSGSSKTINADLLPDTLPETIFTIPTPTADNPTSFHETTWTSSHADMASATLRFYAAAAVNGVRIFDVKFEWGSVRTPWSRYKGDVLGVNNKLAAANISSYFETDAISASYINVATLDALSANLGTVNAGSITGTANIDITGSAKFKGALSLEGGTFSLSANESKARTGGGIFYGTTGKALFGWSNGANGIGVYGYATGAGGTGVYGISTQSDGAGGYFTNTAGGYSLMTGSKISIDGQVFVGNSTVVTNLNADMLDGWHASGFCTKVVGNNGTCNVSGAGFSLSFSTGLTAYEFYSSGNNIMLARSVSDERIKHAIAPEELGLDFVLNLKPVSFRKNSSPEILHHGFIAQDLEKLIGSVNADALSLQYEDGTRGLDYQALIGPLVLAVQQLCNDVRILKEYKNGQNEHDSR
jgi:hypothetical protein